jgi:hypothetical protein
LRAKRFNAVWKVFSDKKAQQIEIERENFESAKLEAQATIIKAKAARIKQHQKRRNLGKKEMEEESEILMGDASNTKSIVKAWYMINRLCILHAPTPARLRNLLEKETDTAPTPTWSRLQDT